MAGGTAVAPRPPISARPGEQAKLAALHEFVEHEQGSAEPARLVGPDGTEHEIPASVYEILVDVVHHMAQGRAVSLEPVNAQLTTQQAAERLGVSRPHLVKLLEAGAIPFTRPGKHRRVRLQDLLDYQRRQAETRRQALDRLALESADLGLPY